MNTHPDQSDFSTPAHQWLTFSFYAFLATVPWSLSIMQMTLVSTTLAAAWQLWRTGRFRFNPLYGFMAAFWALRLLSALFAPRPMSSVISVFQNDWVMLTVPLLAGIRLSEEQWRRALRVFMVSLGLVAIYGIVQFFAGMEYFRGKHLAAYGNHFRATGGFNFYLTYAGNQMMGFAVLLSAFLGSLKNKKPELPYLISGILVLLSIVATFSRSTWLALVVVIAVITLMLDRRWFGWGLISLIAAGTVAAFVSPEIMERITSIWDPAKNAPRLNLWHTGWNMVKANPWLGIGPGEFNRVFEIYKHPGYYDAGGHAHNDMLNLAANSGIPAMLAWLGMWGFLIFSAFKGYRNPQNSAYQRTIIRGMVAAVAGILLAGFFQCYYTDLENNIFWWAMVVWGVNMLPKESGQ